MFGLGFAVARRLGETASTVLFVVIFGVLVGVMAIRAAQSRQASEWGLFGSLLKPLSPGGWGDLHAAAVIGLTIMFALLFGTYIGSIGEAS